MSEIESDTIAVINAPSRFRMLNPFRESGLGSISHDVMLLSQDAFKARLQQCGVDALHALRVDRKPVHPDSLPRLDVELLFGPLSRSVGEQVECTHDSVIGDEK